MNLTRLCLRLSNPSTSASGQYLELPVVLLEHLSRHVSSLYSSRQPLNPTQVTHQYQRLAGDSVDKLHTWRHFTGGKFERYKPEKYTNNKSPQWLQNIHADLMKSVKLPSEKQSHSKGGKSLQSDKSREMLALAANIKQESQKSQQIITSLWRNFDSMHIEDILTVADVFYTRNVQFPAYAKAFVTYIQENIEELHLTPSQMVRLVFHTRQYAPFSQVTALLMELEKKIELSLSEYTISDVANICHLLFYSEHRLGLSLVDKIADKLLHEFDQLSPDNLPMMIKTFRHCNYLKLSFYNSLADRLMSNDYLNNFTTAGQVMHLAFIYASVRITHHELFKHLLERLLEIDQRPRLKDISKIIWACGTLVTTQGDHLHSINALVDKVRETVSDEEVLKYPDNVMDFLVGLAYLGIYPVDLVKRLLGPNAIGVLMGFDASRVKFPQLLLLDESLAIECPEFKGNLLCERHRRVVERKLKDFTVEVDLQLRTQMPPVITALRSLLGEDVVQCCFVLPHFKTADILLQYDKHRKQFVSSSCIKDDTNDVNIERVVVMLVGLSQTNFDGNQPLGMLHCKLRQLALLGYSVVQIDPDEALSYQYLEEKEIQERIMAHISSVLDCPVTFENV